VDPNALHSALGTCAQVIATLYIAIAVEVRSLWRTAKWTARGGFVLLCGSALILILDVFALFDSVTLPIEVWIGLNFFAIAYLAMYFLSAILGAQLLARKNDELAK
jgi:uncharacterized membrane protein (DUF2068 family)